MEIVNEGDRTLRVIFKSEAYFRGSHGPIRITVKKLLPFETRLVDFDENGQGAEFVFIEKATFKVEPAWL